MKKILFIFLIIHSQSLLAQVDESKIKIVPKDYFFYEFSGGNIYEEESDETSELQKFEDEEISKDSILIDVIEMSYPNIQTQDSVLNTFINDTILKILGIDIKEGVFKKMDVSYNSIQDKPSVSSTTFAVHFISSDFISLTLNQEAEACCGANGYSHYNIPLTFDLVNKKIICFEDVIRKKRYDKAYTILFNQYKKNISYEIDLEKYKDQEYLQTILKTSIAVFADKIIIYQNVSYGSKGTDVAITFEYEKHTDLFNKDFLMRVNKKH